MKLTNYLKNFKNICWYPSAGGDLIAPFFVEKSMKLNKRKSTKIIEPDCYIFTDYSSSSIGIDDLLDHAKNKKPIIFENNSKLYKLKIEINNYKELEPLDTKFNEEMVVFDNDKNYNKVYAFDITIRSIGINAYIPVKTTLIYIINENTEFCFNYLLKNNIEISHFIHKCYGNGFGGGRSTGCAIYKILSKLNTSIVIKDDSYSVTEKDVADVYLKDEERLSIPVLKSLDFNYSDVFDWYGYRKVELFEIEDYKFL